MKKSQLKQMIKEEIKSTLNEYEKIAGIASTHEKQLIDAEFDKVKQALSMMQSDLRDYYSEEHRKKFDPIRKKVIIMIEKYMKSLPKKSPGWG